MVKIREATIEDVTPISRVHVESWRTTYVGIMPDELLAGLTVEWRERMWRGILSNPESTTRVFAAEDEHGEVIGFVSGGKPQREVDGFDGELYAIYLLQSAQGQGVGWRLMTALSKRLYQDGCKGMTLWVAEENHPARRFYEAKGGELLPVLISEQYGDKEVREVAYGWRDLSQFKGVIE